MGCGCYPLLPEQLNTSEGQTQEPESKGAAIGEGGGPQGLGDGLGGSHGSE